MLIYEFKIGGFLHRLLSIRLEWKKLIKKENIWKHLQSFLIQVKAHKSSIEAFIIPDPKKAYKFSMKLLETVLIQEVQHCLDWY